MTNDDGSWLKSNTPAGRSWTGKLLPLTKAVVAMAMIGLSVVMMAGLDLPPSELPIEAWGLAAVPQQAGQPVRHAEALPTITVVGRRELANQPAAVNTATVGVATAGEDAGR